MMTLFKVIGALCSIAISILMFIVIFSNYENLTFFSLSMSIIVAIGWLLITIIFICSIFDHD